MSRICFAVCCGEGAVENDEIIAFDHVVVALKNARLEEAKTFGAIVERPRSCRS